MQRMFLALFLTLSFFGCDGNPCEGGYYDGVIAVENDVITFDGLFGKVEARTDGTTFSQCEALRYIVVTGENSNMSTFDNIELIGEMTISGLDYTKTKGFQSVADFGLIPPPVVFLSDWFPKLRWASILSVGRVSLDGLNAVQHVDELTVPCTARMASLETAFDVTLHVPASSEGVMSCPNPLEALVEVEHNLSYVMNGLNTLPQFELRDAGFEVPEFSFPPKLVSVGRRVEVDLPGNIEMPSLEVVHENFWFANAKLESIIAPNLRWVGWTLGVSARHASPVSLPALERVGNLSISWSDLEAPTNFNASFEVENIVRFSTNRLYSIGEMDEFMGSSILEYAKFLHCSNEDDEIRCFDVEQIPEKPPE